MWWDIDSKEDSEKTFQKDTQKEQVKNSQLKDYIAQVKYEEIICLRAKHLQKLVDLGAKEGVQYRIITEHQANAITMIEAVHKKFILEHVYFAVYRMNQRSVKYIDKITDDNSIKTTILLCGFFRTTKNYEAWCQELVTLSENKPNVRIVFYNSHAKVFLAKTKCGKYFVFEGSGNLADNSRIEQYIFENNKQVFDFHAGWIEDVYNDNFNKKML